MRVLPAFGGDVTAMCANPQYLCVAQRSAVDVLIKAASSGRLTRAFAFQPPISWISSVALTPTPVAGAGPQPGGTGFASSAREFLRAMVPRASETVLVCGGFRGELVSLYVDQRSSWKELSVSTSARAIDGCRCDTVTHHAFAARVMRADCEQRSLAWLRLAPCESDVPSCV